MSNKLKTIPDIIAEMRGFKRYATSDSNDCRYVAYWCYQTFADRIEAAYKREMGNAQKMREALQAIVDICDGNMGVPNERLSIYNLAKAALAAPPRNCDVGTVNEQYERFEAFCKRYFREDAACSKDCPCYFWSIFNGECSIKWAQMPYNKEVK